VRLLKIKYKEYFDSTSFLFFTGFFLLISILPPSVVLAQDVSTAGVLTQSRFAPGEFLPISVKLLNFGSGRRVDVSIDYKVIDSLDNEILSSKETVAVETTASFVKLLQLPQSIKRGWYEASASILYADQEFPAISSFEFVVEKKFAGFFISQWLTYGLFAIIFGAVTFFLGRLMWKKKRFSRLDPHEYGDVPKGDRVFYEIISDIIAQMRLRVGDKALELAGGIDGLVIDEETSRVLSVSKNPAKIIALLVLRYENELGEKISFGLRQTEGVLDNDDEAKPARNATHSVAGGEKIKPIDKNLVIVRKYFE